VASLRVKLYPFEVKIYRPEEKEAIEQAISQALEYQGAHADGVELCLRQLLQPEPTPVSLDLSHQPKLQSVGQQPVSLSRYNQLLSGGPDVCQLAA
jgi:hypothetical protein